MRMDETARHYLEHAGDSAQPQPEHGAQAESGAGQGDSLFDTEPVADGAVDSDTKGRGASEPDQS